MTYSVVAKCAKTGQLGVATQSHWPFTGSSVPWAIAGVGAVATQATTEPSYGPRALLLLQGGVAPDDALDDLLADDLAPQLRQVSVMSNSGYFAHHTGAACAAVSDVAERPGAVFTGNLLANEHVVPAMAAAWDESEGEALGWRLLSVLEGAQRAGGDLRGQQAAGLLVVEGFQCNPWEGVVADLRIDDHPEPLVQLRHLLNVREAYNDAHEGDIAATQDRQADALALYERAQTRLPNSAEVAFWRGVLLANNGEFDAARTAFAISRAQGEGWTELMHRVRVAGRLRVSDDDYARLF